MCDEGILGLGHFRLLRTRCNEEWHDYFVALHPLLYIDSAFTIHRPKEIRGFGSKRE